MKKYWALPLSMMLVLITFSSCKKDDDQNKNALELSTTDISNITYKSAVSGGIVVSDGGSSIVKQGVCWSTAENPTIADNFTVDEGEGSFDSYITGIADETTYFVRSYATNETDTGYGNQVSFETPDKPSSSFNASIDGIPYNPTHLTKSIVAGIMQIAALKGSQNMIIRIPENFTIGTHSVSMDPTSYSAQYFPGNSQIFTSTSGSGSINILEHDVQTGRIKASFNFIGSDINISSTVNVTNGLFEVTFN